MTRVHVICRITMERDQDLRYREVGLQPHVVVETSEEARREIVRLNKLCKVGDLRYYRAYRIPFRTVESR